MSRLLRSNNCYAVGHAAQCFDQDKIPPGVRVKVYLCFAFYQKKINNLAYQCPGNRG